MATETKAKPTLPVQESTSLKLTMSVLKAAGDYSVEVPVPGTLHEKPNGEALPGPPLARNTEAEAEASELDETGCWVKVKAGTAQGWCHLSGLVPTLGKHLPWLEVAQREVGVGELHGPGLARNPPTRASAIWPMANALPPKTVNPAMWQSFWRVSKPTTRFHLISRLSSSR